MSITLPILRDHDPEKVIGQWHVDDGRVIGEMHSGHELTREQLFNVFGGAGIRVVEQNIRVDESAGKHEIYIRKFEVVEFSLCPMNLSAATTERIRRDVDERTLLETSAETTTKILQVSIEDAMAKIAFLCAMHPERQPVLRKVALFIEQQRDEIERLKSGS